MIGIIDYNAGNIRSVKMALDFLQIPHVVAKTPAELRGAQKLILPGVGDAAYAMSELCKSGFDSFIKDEAARGTPLLGICLGSQIIFDNSEEGETECLGLVSGSIRHFKTLFAEQGAHAADGAASDTTGADGAHCAQNTAATHTDQAALFAALKVPHMGWNNIHFTPSPLFTGVAADASFYFVHSYVIAPTDWAVVRGWANYGIKVPAVIAYRNIVACQFHPEKSGSAGLALLRNFCTASADALKAEAAHGLAQAATNGNNSARGTTKVNGDVTADAHDFAQAAATTTATKKDGHLC